MRLGWVLLSLYVVLLCVSWVSMLMGIVVGHLYFFLTMKYPQEYGGAQLISTPQIL